MKEMIIALVLLVALLVMPVSAVVHSTEEAFKSVDRQEDALVHDTSANTTNYAIIAIIAIVIIAGGVYLGLKMYNKNHPPADNSEKK